MLHLSVNDKFTYLNYLSVMSAIRYNTVKIWINDPEPTGKYWDIVKKVKSITFEIYPETNVVMDVNDQVGHMHTIYLSALNDNYLRDSMIDHVNMYLPNGTFETKDMCVVPVFQPEVVTPEYVQKENTALAQLIRRVLLERVWNQ